MANARLSAACVIGGFGMVGFVRQGAASPMFVVMGVEGSHQRRGSMEYGTFKLWLIERGCRFDTQPKQRGEGHGAGGPRSYC